MTRYATSTTRLIWPLTFLVRLHFARIFRETEQNSVINAEIDLLSPTSVLEFVAIDILSTLSRTRSGYQYVFFITNTQSKLIQAIPTTVITLPQVINIFLKYWFIPYSIPATFLCGSRQQFVSEFCTSMRTYLGAKNYNHCVSSTNHRAS